MRDATSESALAGAAGVQEAPEIYHRLLAEYVQLLNGLDFNPYGPPLQVVLWSLNPRRQHRFWSMPQLRDFGKVPDAVRQDLPCASDLLRRVHALPDQQLRALARCSALNVGKLTHRVLLGAPNGVFVALAALLAAARGLKEAFGVDLGAFVEPAMPILVAALIGAVLGVVLNLLMSYHRLRLVRALDDIISIAMAARSLPP